MLLDKANNSELSLIVVSLTDILMKEIPSE